MRPCSLALSCALACAVACGPAATKGARPGGTGGSAGAPDAVVLPDVSNAPDAGVTSSCSGAGDAGATCVQFDPGSPAPGAVCAAQGEGPVIGGPCARDGSAGGCHVVDPPSGYTIWWYAPQTADATMFRCFQLGQSYVSPARDVAVDGGP